MENNEAEQHGECEVLQRMLGKKALGEEFQN